MIVHLFKVQFHAKGREFDLAVSCTGLASSFGIKCFEELRYALEVALPGTLRRAFAKFIYYLSSGPVVNQGSDGLKLPVFHGIKKRGITFVVSEL